MDLLDVARPGPDEAVSPRQSAPPIEQAVQSLRTIDSPLNNSLNPLDMRADPDAQATVTDFLDFTEYLPSDMMRSLTLIGNLDQNYVDASMALDELTSQWGQLPVMSPESRPRPVELRAQISEKLNRTISSRAYAHAEAIRMSENLNRHHTRIKVILSKLETMLENYTEAEVKSPVATAKSPQTSTQKLSMRGDGQKVRRPRIPRITIPGEVLAPYELNYDAYTSDGSSSEDDDDDDEEKPASTSRATSDGPTRIKVVKSTSRSSKPGKVPKSRTSVPPPSVPGHHLMSTSAALAQLKPPPENAVAGSAEAPWGQLTGWELNRLRKRMKKNSNWTPSDTMIARELFNLKRGIDAFNLAKQKAEEEGREFEGKMPVPIIDPISGEERMPLGALSMETLASDEKNLSNRGMKLNEAKKLKREMLAKMAAEEAEESAKLTKLIADAFMGGGFRSPQVNTLDQANRATPGKANPPQKKRKRDSAPEVDADKPELADGQAPKTLFKRTKTETPVPPPQLSASTSQVAHETPVQPPPPRPVVHSTTPIPLPIHAQDHQSITAKSGTSVASATSPAPSSNAGAATTTTNPILAPVKLPGPETPIPPPVHSPKKITPIYPPARETRKTQAARIQEQQETHITMVIKPQSRAASPVLLTPQADSDTYSTASGPTSTATVVAAPSRPVPETVPHTTTVARRPASRGKAGSQEPQPTLASERQRRASTARNTPAPDQRPPSRRSSKRPPPGTISRTISGGKSAVGKRKAAPKKKKGSGSGTKSSKDKVSAGDDIDVEIDDDGNEIDPDEPRYCVCNGVSYGVMIQCDNIDNIDNCKHEWFHIDCVGLSEIPARTTKWYCPECRVLLKIGEKGEVTARGVKA